jgi:hypothetical protein
VIFSFYEEKKCSHASAKHSDVIVAYSFICSSIYLSIHSFLNLFFILIFSEYGAILEIRLNPKVPLLFIITNQPVWLPNCSNIR